MELLVAEWLMLFVMCEFLLNKKLEIGSFDWVWTFVSEDCYTVSDEAMRGEAIRSISTFICLGAVGI